MLRSDVPILPLLHKQDMEMKHLAELSSREGLVIRGENIWPERC